ncbi:hypothetical protein [Azospirillum doebereinerae]
MERLKGIRRSAVMPYELARHLEAIPKLRRRLSIPVPAGVVDFSYHQSRRFRMMDGEGAVRKREFVGRILVDDHQAGALRFVEYTPDPMIDNSVFFETMDADSISEYVLASVLCEGWSHLSSDVSDYGPIIELSTAWMAPAFARGGLWARVAEHVIEHVSPRHALLIMKAFPLEYEALEPEGSSLEQNFLVRQAAMKRYYRRLFGVQSFPGEAGEDGWLWRVGRDFDNLIPSPNSR